jgi:hypothetical protein
MKDAALKTMLFKHFWAQRSFTQVEVEIYPDEGVSYPRKVITDIDVYALRPTGNLAFERVLGDCKTLKSQSPVHRSLWLAGLMKLLGAQAGFVLLSPAGGIEQDHKLTANQVGVALLTEEDFHTYDKAILPPTGSTSVEIEPVDVYKIHDVYKQFPPLRELCAYLASTAWQEPGFGALIRHILGQLRVARGEFDPKRADHQALLVDAAAMFSAGLAECSGIIFNQYIHPTKKTTLADSLKLLLWGGRASFEAYQNIRAKLIATTRGSNQEQLDDDPGLPEWNGFIQLVRHYLDVPAAAFQVPWLLRAYAVTISKGQPPRTLPVTQNDLHLLKLAMLTVAYVCRAAGVPRDFENTLTYPLVVIQSALATPARPP